jgi:hypothetical protein
VLATLSVGELATVVVALIAFVIAGLYRLLTEQMTLRERIAKLEAKIEELLRGRG